MRYDKEQWLSDNRYCRIRASNPTYCGFEGSFVTYLDEVELVYLQKLQVFELHSVFSDILPAETTGV
ncbi:hypothetical protein [Cohnella sp.]|uniref:hypothetical protein n=1 Tax=Cohnella sp. TaxID=1883426 RepID=UPI00356137A7